MEDSNRDHNVPASSAKTDDRDSFDLLSTLFHEDEPSRNEIASKILQCLRYADLLRLRTCCRTLNASIPTHHPTIADWLYAIEPFYCVRVDRNPSLRSKIFQSLKSFPDRSRFCAHVSEQEWVDDVGTDFVEAMNTYAWEYFVDGGLDMTIISNNDLNAYCNCREGDAYDPIRHVDDDGSDLEEDPRKRIRRLDCDSKERCARATSNIDHDDAETNTNRIFHIGHKSYCGACLEFFPFLKLQFCFEHVTGQDADWSCVELALPEDQDSAEVWGLRDDEFWVQVFFYQPHLSGEIRFLGKRP